jgi:hypothetical protein
MEGKLFRKKFYIIITGTGSGVSDVYWIVIQLGQYGRYFQEGKIWPKMKKFCV